MVQLYFAADVSDSCFVVQIQAAASGIWFWQPTAIDLEEKSSPEGL